MKQTIERVTAMALEQFGEGELYINQFGNAFWRMPDGREMPLGYTVFEAERWLIKLSEPLGSAPDHDEEEE
jgi:hypothetical protein